MLPLHAFLLALLSGSLYALSNIGFGVWPFVFFFLIPFWFALDTSQSKPNLKRAGGLGFVFGLCAFATGFPWLLSLTDDFLGSGLFVGSLLWLVFGIWFALGFSVYGILYRCLSYKRGPNSVASIAPFILMEWWQVSLFPSYSGAALIKIPILAQIADLGGPLLLSTFVIFINSRLYFLFRRYQSKQRFPINQTVSAAMIFMLVIIYGHLRSESILEDKHGDPIRIGAVQSNLVKLSKEALSLRSHAVHVKQSKDILAKHPVDLLIWPETAYVRGLRRPLPLDAQFIRADITVPLLFGGTSVWQKNGKKAKANSVFLANKQGSIEQAYDKSKLIPFAEYIPFPSFLTPYKTHINALFPHSQSFHSQATQKAINLNTTVISTPICYEIIHPDFIRQQINHMHPQLIITLANDAWFGDTQEPWIHLSLARLRAIEHRLWIVRSTNSGISAIIDPAGNITSHTGLHTQENLLGTVYPRNTSTYYAQFGNWVGWLALLFMLLRTYGLLARHEKFSVLIPPLFSNRRG